MRTLRSLFSIAVALVLVSSVADAGSVPVFCPPGQYQNGSLGCFPCAPVLNCNGPVTCTNGFDSICSTCSPGFWRSATPPTTCNPCTPVTNCNGPLTCTGPESSQCPTCLPGHYRDASGTACPACTPIADCNSPLECEDAATSRCPICALGHYSAPGGPTTSDTCPICPSDPNCVFAECTNASDSVCLNCNVGYQPNSAGVCEPICFEIAGCEAVTCASPGLATCTQCEAGRYLVDGEDVDLCPPCTAIENCAAATCTNDHDSVCGTCQPGYYLTENTCAACTPVTGCVSQLTCTTAGDSVCTACETGYAPGPTGCEPICDPIAHCATPGACPSPGAGQCDACDSGYYLDDSGTADVCTACAPVEHCAVAGTCTSADTAQCTTCDQGYRLVDGTADVCVVATHDIPIAGNRARFGDLPRKRQSLVTSYDAAIDVMALDPTTSGATLAITSSATGETFVLELPASGWQGPLPGRRFRYSAAGGTRVKVLLLNGRMLRIDLRGTGAFALGEPQGQLTVLLTVGDTRFCTTFGGTITKDDGKRFISRKAPRPATCTSPGNPT